MAVKYIAELKFRLPIAYKKDDGIGYVVCCPPLDIYSQGANKKEALKNIKEAVSLFVVSCFERGTLDQVLKEAGFNAGSPRIAPKRPSKANTNIGTINVPIPLLFNNQTAQPAECRA